MIFVSCIENAFESCLFLADSGVGAGIDSYYEYLLKAYILLGDDLFLQRFNIVRAHTHAHTPLSKSIPPLSSEHFVIRASHTY